MLICFLLIAPKIIQTNERRVLCNNLNPTVLSTLNDCHLESFRRIYKPHLWPFLSSNFVFLFSSGSTSIFCRFFSTLMNSVVNPMFFERFVLVINLIFD